MKPQIRDISVKAVVLGGLVDIVATNILLIPVAVVVLVRLGPGIPAGQQTAALTEAFTSNPTLYLVSLFLGCVASVLGGWSAARLAERAELVNGALSAFACVGLGIYGMVEYPAAAPLWQHIAFFALSPTLGALGALIRIRQRQSGLEATSFEAATVTQTPLTPSRRGLPRFVYYANRALIAVATLMLLFFGLIGLYGYSRHNGDVILGSVILSGFGLSGMVLLYFGGRALRGGHARHWVLNASGLAVTLIPIALFLLALSLSRKGAG